MMCGLQVSWSTLNTSSNKFKKKKLKKKKKKKKLKYDGFV